MSLQERTGVRDLTFSGWHRSLRDDLHYIDIDYCGYCRECREVLVVAEVCFDHDQHKPTTVTRKVAEGLRVPGLLIRYQTDEAGELSGFRVRHIWPYYTPFEQMTPEMLSEWIERTHDDHVCEDA